MCHAVRGQTTKRGARERAAREPPGGEPREYAGDPERTGQKRRRESRRFAERRPGGETDRRKGVGSREAARWEEAVQTARTARRGVCGDKDREGRRGQTARRTRGRMSCRDGRQRTHGQPNDPERESRESMRAARDGKRRTRGRENCPGRDERICERPEKRDARGHMSDAECGTREDRREARRAGPRTTGWARGPEREERA